MPNITWYISIALISLGISAYFIYKKREAYKVSTLLMFYIFSTSIAWIGEFIVLGLFNAYHYKTGLFPDPWAQNLLAHLILNSTMFPAAALAIIGSPLHLSRMALVAAAFIIPEYVFTKIGLYEHYWWRYFMSVINVSIFMLISSKWFYRMNRLPRGSTRAITFYFIALVLLHTPVPILLLMGKQHFYLEFVYNLFGNFYRSSTLIAFTYHLVAPFVFVIFVCVLKKWHWKIMCYVFSITVYIILNKMNILIMDNGWRLTYTILIQQILVTSFILLEKYTWKPKDYIS